MDLESPIIAMAGSMIAMMDDGSNVLQHAHHPKKSRKKPCKVALFHDTFEEMGPSH